MDTSKLPAPASVTVDFDRDIHPIFEQSCLRCHGSERPKSRFSLVARETALKGGDENTDDIVPGASARSRLIQYVAGLVEDMHMPPKGKAPSLTTNQIALLRAWIDQGALWSATNPYPRLALSFAPTLSWVGVSGDASKFREIEGFKEGWGGGVEQFSIEQKAAADRTLRVEGHYLAEANDLRLKLTWTKTDVGFIRAGIEQWRRYYDDTGGYYPAFSPPSYDLGRDLYLDVGRVWVDLGLTLPRWPQIVLGYEYQYKNGSKSMLEWGTVNGKKIYPAAKNIDEFANILKLEVTHDLYGWHLADRGRLEFYTDNTLDQQITSYTTGPDPNAWVNTRQQSTHVQGANTFWFEKQLKEWWRFSGGYLYSQFNGNSSMNQSTVDPMNNVVSGTYWNNRVTLQNQMNDFSLASLFLPLDSLSLSLGVQGEFSSQEGFGNISLDQGDPYVPGQFLLQPGKVQSDLDETKIQENAQLQYTGVPFTVLFAEGRFAQDSISQFEQETGNTPDVFLRDTDYFNSSVDSRAGFSTSPWRCVSLTAHYRYRDSASDYNNNRDQSPYGGEGYSAFIRSRDIRTDETLTKLVLHPVTWLKTTLSWQWSESGYTVTTDPITDPVLGPISPGGTISSGTYRANVYGVNATFLPSQRLYFSGAFTYTDSRLTTAQNGVPSVVPYEGSIYTVITTANYSLNPRTRLQAAYSFSQADYGQNNLAGLPLGVEYTRHGLALGLARKLTKHLSSTLRYSFYDYSEPSTGGVNNFTAQGVFVTLHYQWP